MKSIYRLLLILALSFQLSPQAMAAYCQADWTFQHIEGGDWKEINEDSKELYEGFYKKVGSQSLSRLSNTTIYSKANAILSRAKNEFRQARAKLELKDPNAQFDFKVQIERYAYIASELMTVQLGVSPFSKVNIADVQKKYGELIPRGWLRQDFHIRNQNYKLVPVTVDGKKRYRITPNPSHIIQIAMRSQSMSPRATSSSKQNGDRLTQNYIKTVKCLMANELAMSYVKSRLIDGKAPQNNINYTKMSCRGISINSLISLHAKEETAKMIKLQLLSDAPLVEKGIDSTEVEKLVEALESGNQGQDFSDLSFNTEFNEQLKTLFLNNINRQVSNNKALKALYQLTDEEIIQGETDNIINSCGIRTSKSQFLEDFKKAYKIAIVYNYQSLLDSQQINSSQSGTLQTSLLNMLSRLHHTAIANAIVKAAELNLSDNVPSDEIQFLAFEFLHKTTFPVNLRSNSEAVTAVNSLIANTNRKVLSKNGPARKMYIEGDGANETGIVKAAQLATKYMDSRTPMSQLPYKRTAIVSYYYKELGEISPSSQPLLGLLMTTDDGSTLQEVYNKSIDVLEAELTRLGGSKRSQEPGWATRSMRWIRNTNRWSQMTIKEKRINEINSDLRILNKVASGLGIQGSSSDKDNFADAVSDQDLSGGKLTEFKQHYREALLEEILGKYRPLDLTVLVNKPIRVGQERDGTGSKERIPLYKLLGKSNLSKNKIDTYVDFAISKTVLNQLQNMRKVNDSSNLSDLKDFIQKSNLLYVLLGSSEIDRNIVTLDTAHSQYNNPSSYNDLYLSNAFPHLVRRHAEQVNQWSQSEALRRHTWETTFASISYGALPFFGGWLTKMGLRALPFRAAHLGSASISNLYVRTMPFWSSYFDFFLGAIAVDFAYTGGLIYNNLSEQQTIAGLTYTDYADRSLLFAQDVPGGPGYLAQKEYLSQELSDLSWRMGTNALWLGIAGFGKHGVKLFQNFKQGRITRQERLMATNSDLRQSVEIAARKKFRKLGRLLIKDFRTLGMRNPNFNIGELRVAKSKIRSQGDGPVYQQAEQAYNRIVNSVIEEIAPIAFRPNNLSPATRTERIYAEAAFGDASQMEAWLKAYNNIHKGAQ